MFLRRLVLTLLAIAVVLACAAVPAVLTGADVSLRPFDVTSKRVPYALASAQVLVDVPESALAAIEAPNRQVLTAKARLYSSFVTLPSVRRAALEEAGLPAAAPVVFASATSGTPDGEDVTPDTLRQLEGRAAVVLLSTRAGLPVIDLTARAPDSRLATRLLLGTARGLRRHVRSLPTRDVGVYDVLRLRVMGSTTVRTELAGPTTSEVVLAGVGGAVAGFALIALGAVALRLRRRRRELVDGAARPSLDQRPAAPAA